MSPNSAGRAEKLGYTNVKVYHEGLPEWLKKNYAVLSPQFLKEAWIDKDIPHVLLDVRAARESKRGFIKGAVAFPAQRNAAAPLIKKLDLKKNAPLIVYSGKDQMPAIAVAKELLKAGYGNVRVLTGGFEAWKVAGFPVSSGKLATKATYIPKPRPGEISIEEFTKIATNTPPDVMILDVRNQDEGNAGMIKGAKLVPDEELAQRFDVLLARTFLHQRQVLLCALQ